MENGRYLTGPNGYLVSKCKATKIYPNGGMFYGLDACMANLMRPGMYGSYHHIYVPERETFTDSVNEKGNRKKANIVGTLCENNDWFAKDRSLPADTSVGDLFVICDTGAHSHSMGFQYNGKLRAPEVLLTCNNEKHIIRERETIHCLFDNTRLVAGNDKVDKYPYNGRKYVFDSNSSVITAASRTEILQYKNAFPSMEYSRYKKWKKYAVYGSFIVLLSYSLMK